MTRPCYAIGCTRHVKPELLMCRQHWYLVPKALRDEVWRTYEEGRASGAHPTRDYARAIKAAQTAVKEIEEAQRARELFG